METPINFIMGMVTGAVGVAVTIFAFLLTILILGLIGYGIMYLGIWLWYKLSRLKGKE